MQRKELVSLPRWQKRLLSLVVDVVIIWFALFAAFTMRLGLQGIERYWPLFFKLCLISPLIILPVYVRLGLYRAVLRYMGTHVVLTILRANVLAIFGIVMTAYVLGLDVPRSLPFLFGSILVLIVTASRYAVRYWLAGHKLKDILFSSINLSHTEKHTQHGMPVAVYGAGDAGMQLVLALSRSREYQPVAFIDDNPALQNCLLLGKQIYSSDQMTTMINDTHAEEILLAMPSVKRHRRAEIVKTLETYGLPIKTMPDMRDLASGRLKLQHVQEVDIADVLGREEVKPIPELIEKHIAGKVVMVTGAGGSIGSEMVRQALIRKPKSIVLFDHSEFNLYTIDRELQHLSSNSEANIEIVTVLGSINDPYRMLDIMRTYKVETLYHAAAYKHVPIVQYNVSQGLRNNVLGSLYTAQAAIAAGVKNFVLISTDKAVRPTNVMGASKRLAEMVLQAISNEKELTFYHAELFGLTNEQTIPVKTQFTMVRFGNVLGSSGSVIPVFRDQIKSGGPVTVTHPDINRYFMTIPEAAQLVIQAGAMGQGGDVFVLEMGEPVKIVDLAKRMVSLSGLSVKDDANYDGDIEIVYTGLRQGEKLYEELLIGDNVTETDHPRICRATEEMLEWSEFKQALDNIMHTLKEHNYAKTRELLLKYVNGYRPVSKVVDWLYEHENHTLKTNDVA